MLCFYSSVMSLMLWPSIAYNALLRKAYLRYEPSLEWLYVHVRSKAHSVLSKYIENVCVCEYHPLLTYSFFYSFGIGLSHKPVAVLHMFLFLYLGSR